MRKTWMVFLLFISGILLLKYDDFMSNQKKIKEEAQINTFLETKLEIRYKNSYIAILEIPKINLKKGLFSLNNPNNNINHAIQILETSNMPDQNGNLILAGHSGIGEHAYFNRLHELYQDDIISIYYKNKKYDYQIYHKYEILKTGYMKIPKIQNQKILTIITCRFRTNKQLILQARQIKGN